MDKNKVRFGLRNVHYWEITYDNLTDSITYGDAQRWPGAVSMTLETAGDPVEFKADDITYFYNQNNQGYIGTFTSALVPNEFRIKHLGEKLDEASGVQFETSEGQSSAFAFAFEVQGDQHARRYIYYSCNASRPSFTAETSDTGEPQAEEISFTAGPRSTDYLVKANAPTDSNAYATWFDKPWEPDRVVGV